MPSKSIQTFNSSKKTRAETVIHIIMEIIISSIKPSKMEDILGKRLINSFSRSLLAG